MTTTTQTQAPIRPMAGGGIPFSRLLQVEFRKSWDTRASFWLLFCIGAIVLIAELIAAIVTGVQDVKDVEFGTFATVAGFISQLLLPVLGIMLVTSEWSQRTAMVTFAAAAADALAGHGVQGLSSAATLPRAFRIGGGRERDRPVG